MKSIFLLIGGVAAEKTFKEGHSDYFGTFKAVCDTDGDFPHVYVELPVENMASQFGKSFFELGEGDATIEFPEGCPPIKFVEFFSVGGVFGHSPWDGKWHAESWSAPEADGSRTYIPGANGAEMMGGWEMPHFDFTFGSVTKAEKDHAVETCKGCPGDPFGMLKCCINLDLVDNDEKTAEFFNWPPAEYISGGALSHFFPSPGMEWGNHCSHGRGCHMFAADDIRSYTDAPVCVDNPNQESWDELVASDYYLADRVEPDACWQKCAVQAEGEILYGKGFIDYGCRVPYWFDGVSGMLIAHNYKVLGYEAQLSFKHVIENYFSKDQTTPWNNPYYQEYPIPAEQEQPGHVPTHVYVEITDEPTPMLKLGFKMSKETVEGCPLCCVQKEYPASCADEEPDCSGCVSMAVKEEEEECAMTCDECCERRLSGRKLRFGHMADMCDKCTC